MATLKIKKEGLLVGENRVQFEACFDKEFYEYSDALSDEYTNDSIFSNELFINIIQRHMALEQFILRNEIDNIIIYSRNELSLYAYDIAQKKSISIKHNNISYKIKILFISRFWILLSALYLSFLMLKISFCRQRIDFRIPFAVIRTKAAKSKLKNMAIRYEYEDPYSQDSMYRLFRVRKRLLWVFFAFIESFSQLVKAKGFIKEKLGCDSSFYVYEFYQKRIVHTMLYDCLIDNYLRLQTGGVFYTCNNLDRFSVIEENKVRKYNLKSICIPHGLEYGFKFPKGFSCDVHYTNSAYAADYLNKLYNTTKFIFDFDIASKMFRISEDRTMDTAKVVFFTEPREVYVNQEIIKELLPLLNEKGINLYLKLHPNDKVNDYSKYGLEIIENLGDAICGNICVSRKSTTLLEATYNNSVAAAIITNVKDESIFNTFPSLQSERITVTKSVSELFEWICQQYDKFNK